MWVLHQVNCLQLCVNCSMKRKIRSRRIPIAPHHGRLKGPEPGIKWRGGTPPAPPTWKYNASDLRAFSPWERRVQVWQLQVKPYLSPSDAALTLFTSLTGEAEQEVEHMEQDRIHHKDGIS